ncbi:Hpt domain-containing protein [Arthrobacter sp. AOP36-A1-22]|uniref:Hpt domain-containing protein n=1 Tax=Arthrobacter sp. AOP36-A1-22 TaxID=3457684 RepID=UPI0040346146
MTEYRRLKHPGTSLLVRPSVLCALVDQLGEAEAAAFVDRFVRLWPQRRRRLHLAVDQHDVAAGLDAALSLSSGASMAGANSLAALASRLHEGIPTANTPGAWRKAAAMLDELDQLGNATISDVVRLRRTIMPSEQDSHG